MELIQSIGATPLPPYIRRARRAHGESEVVAADALRYNTVYATEPGSVAAPTAGLHFTPELLAGLDRRGVRRAMVTLHIGLGTFAPVRTAIVEDHSIHSEWIDIAAETIAALADARERGSRIIPIGTTSVRALESLPDDWQSLGHNGYQAETTLFITPDTVANDDSPFQGFRFADALMTNFHLPYSTLLALVAALPDVGIARLKQWYAAAIDERYRFYSYGDAMLLL
jgi:S-adenosylmethionine:tRNA ribosyltransferase-isomerase